MCLLHYSDVPSWLKWTHSEGAVRSGQDKICVVTFAAIFVKHIYRLYLLGSGHLEEENADALISL